MRYKDYRINTWIDSGVYDDWKEHLRKKGHCVFGRESELTWSTRRCLEYGIRAAMRSPKIMKEVMADDTDNTTPRG